MSRIKDIIGNRDSILVFDVDGVLARIEYGEYNHYGESDEEWDRVIREGGRFYQDDVAIKTMKDYLSQHNMDNVYVCTKVMNPIEGDMKVDFLVRNYGIEKDNIFYVFKNEEKLDVLKKIHEEKYPDEKECEIALVDDTISVLTYVMENSGFATIHVSSFMP